VHRGGVREVYCDSGPNIIVTNARLQAPCGFLLTRRGSRLQEKRAVSDRRIYFDGRNIGAVGGDRTKTAAIGKFGAFPLNRQLQPGRASLIPGLGTTEIPGFCAESISEKRNVFITNGETRGLGRGE
jgi:hypothetical protein